MRKKAILAVAFAGGILNAQLPALSKDDPNSTDFLSKNNLKSTGSFMRQILNNEELDIETRAFYMLLIADCYLRGDSTSAVDAQFISAATESSSKGSWNRRKRAWENSLLRAADRVSLDRTTVHGTNKKSVDAKNTDAYSKNTDSRSNNSRVIPYENLDLAKTAMQQALTKLEEIRAPFAKLNMYFIASRLFQKMGNVDEMQKCNAVLEKTFQSYEANSLVYEDEIKAASSVLDSMSYGLIPIRIPDRETNPASQKPPIESFTEKDFKASEKLRRRSVALADRLDSSNHVRRKAHRDLSLWYKQLGKNQLADKEKQVLFQLVGIHDDSILYPYSPGCADLVWWEKDDKQFGFDCGMG